MLEIGQPSAVPEVSRTLQAFARAARARQLYDSHNRAYIRMRESLMQALEQTLVHLNVLSLRIRPDRLVFADATVLEEPNPQDSIPFALYRDGLRRMEFSRGVTEAEVEALLSATAAGFAYSGLGDDIVSFLWKHDLQHIQYLVVDTTFIEAASGASPEGSAETAPEDVDAQIDGLLHAIYGESTDDVGPKVVHLDAADLAAKQIASALDDVDEMATGLHPARRAPSPPTYGRVLIDEARREDSDRVAARAANAALRALHLLDGVAADLAADALLRMFDTAVMAADLSLAGRIAAGVRATPPPYPLRIVTWLEEAISEARIRHVLRPAAESRACQSAFTSLVQFFRACGPQVVPLLLPMLGRFSDPGQRRALSDLAIELGPLDGRQVRLMLDDRLITQVQEGLYITRRTAPAEDVAAAWAAVEHHPNPLARIALLESLCGETSSSAVNVATRMLDDPEPRVRVAAVECLAQLRHVDAPTVLASTVEGLGFDPHPPEVKRALLAAYAQTNGPRALPMLSRTIRRGEGRLVRRESEELAIHAVLAASMVQDPKARELLTQMAESKNRRIREAAQQILGRGV